MVRQFFGLLGVVVSTLPKTKPVFIGEAASQERGQTPSTARFDAVALPWHCRCTVGRCGPMWAGVGAKNAWGGSGRSTTVQRPFSGRSELSVAQRAHYSKRRKEIWEALHPEPSVDYGREDGEGEEEIQVAQVAPPEFGYKKGGW